MKFDIDQIAQATNDNNHWKAALIIAKELGLAHEFERLQSIEFQTFERGYSEEQEIAERSATIKTILGRYPDLLADAIRKVL